MKNIAPFSSSAAPIIPSDNVIKTVIEQRYGILLKAIASIPCNLVHNFDIMTVEDFKRIAGLSVLSERIRMLGKVMSEKRGYERFVHFFIVRSVSCATKEELDLKVRSTINTYLNKEDDELAEAIVKFALEKVWIGFEEKPKEFPQNKKSASVSKLLKEIETMIEEHRAGLSPFNRANINDNPLVQERMASIIPCINEVLSSKEGYRAFVIGYPKEAHLPSGHEHLHVGTNNQTTDHDTTSPDQDHVKINTSDIYKTLANLTSEVKINNLAKNIVLGKKSDYDLWIQISKVDKKALLTKLKLDDGTDPEIVEKFVNSFSEDEIIALIKSMIIEYRLLAQK